MTDELKPCPFCGGKAAMHTMYMGDGHRYRAIECVECGATTPGNYSEAGDQSLWDWDQRHVETCELLGSYYYDDYDLFEHEFSCGHSVNMHDKEPTNYCPICGAKVVK